jgi:hypothetical protein
VQFLLVHGASSLTGRRPERVAIALIILMVTGGQAARYKFRCVVVENPRLRALLESYATGQLCPAHLGLGEIG